MNMPAHIFPQLSQCTAAGVVPPDSFASSFHALVLGPSTVGLLRLIQGLVQRRPRLLSPQVGWCCLFAQGSPGGPHDPCCGRTVLYQPGCVELRYAASSIASHHAVQVLPPLLCEVITALASHPVVGVCAPELYSWAVASLPTLCPAAAAQQDSVTQLAQQRHQLEAAVKQLACAPTAALAAACCREVQQLLPALELLNEQEQDQAVATAMDAAVRHGASPAAGALASRLLLHHRPAVRLAALAALDAALHTAGQAAPLLLLQPAVVGSLAVEVGAEPAEQQLAASMLQAADSSGLGRALLPWEAWLLCHASHPAFGPAVACSLQAAAGQKGTVFEQLRPVLLGLFHSTPAVAAEAAQQLHAAIIQQRPAAAASMLYCPLPFDGLLVPAGTAVGQHDSAAKAAAAAAARLFTAADVQSLLAVLFSPSVQADLAAAALGQLAQVAGDARFGVLLGQEPGGLISAGLFSKEVPTTRGCWFLVLICLCFLPYPACSAGHSAAPCARRPSLPPHAAASAGMPGGPGRAAALGGRLAASGR